MRSKGRTLIISVVLITLMLCGAALTVALRAQTPGGPGQGGQGGQMGPGMMGPGGQGGQGGQMGPGMMGPGGQGGQMGPGMMGPGGQGGQMGPGMMGPGGQGGQMGPGMMGPGGQGGPGGQMGPGMMGPGRQGQGGQGMQQISEMPLNTVDISRGLVSLNSSNNLKLSKVQKEKVVAILRKMDASLARAEENSAMMEKIFTKDQLDYIKSRRSYGMQGIEMSAGTPDQIKQGVDPIIVAAIKSLKEKPENNQQGGAQQPGAQQPGSQAQPGAQRAGGAKQQGGQQQPGGVQNGPGPQKPQ